MERMIQGVDDGLRRRLDRLETRGRHALLTTTRRRAVRRALAWAAPASAAGPLLLALSAPFVAPTVAGVLIAAVGAPLAAGVFGYMRARQATSRTRTAALALLDHRLRLNDRLQTSDEFERLDRRTAFHDAALQEAAPWVARAQDSDVGDDDGALRLGRSRLWLWPAAGILCLAAAFAVPQFWPEAAAPANPAAAAVSPRSAAVAAPEARSENTTPIAGAASPTAPGRDVEGTTRPGLDKPGAGLAAAFQRLMARLSPSRSAAASAQDAAARAGAPSQSAAGQGEGRGRGGQGAAGNSASSSGAGQDREARQPQDDEQTPGEAMAQDKTDAPASQAPGGQSSGARQNAPSAARPQPQDSGSGQSQSGEGQQPGRSRRGDQNQSGREQGGGQGENGGQSGPETGLKKGRGVSSLMLATPMQDRLGGMASPGRIRTTTRDGAPQPLPANGVRAQDRGMARGEAARTAPLAASAQEQRATRDYFNARNGGGR